MGEAGMRMMENSMNRAIGKNIFTATDYRQVVNIAREVTQPGKICLLSPAAASYDMFKNFGREIPTKKM
ncbi:MAG: hypothetical protein U0Z17_07725 [Bacteroidales bacterium]